MTDYITIDRKVVEQALEALEGLRDLFYQDTIEALRAAIEAAEKVEPVAWIDGDGNACFAEYVPAGTKLYTSPQPALDEYITGGVKELGDFRPLQVTTPQPAIPAGYALVRLFELENALESYDGGDGQSCHRILRNIIAAAPKPENSHE